MRNPGDALASTLINPTNTMRYQPIPPDILSARFPEHTGFEFMNSGGYKTVYSIVRADGEPEVLKVIRLPLEGATEEEVAFRRQELGRARREVALLRDCTSPFVVKLGSVFPAIHEIEGEECVVYSEERLPGQDLKALIASKSAPSAEEIKLLLSCLVQAIRSLWRDQHTVHRDIKPANVVATGIVERPYVLLDLGIAYNVREAGLTANADDIPATPQYMAPEMLDPNFREHLSYRADLYATGVTAFEFATGGIHPLARSADDVIRTISRILRQEPRVLASDRPDLPATLTTLVDQLIKKNPALRPGNLNLLLNKLT